MFQFPGLPPASLCVREGVAGNDSRWVFPFGDPRVKGRVPLTVDYRSLPRPSSASSAKASTACPYHLLTSMVRYTHICCDQMRSSVEENLACAMRLSRYVGGRALETGRCEPEDLGDKCHVISGTDGPPS
jgi:hypothetical protein